MQSLTSGASRTIECAEHQLRAWQCGAAIATAGDLGRGEVRGAKRCDLMQFDLKA